MKVVCVWRNTWQKKDSSLSVLEWRKGILTTSNVVWRNSIYKSVFHNGLPEKWGAVFVFPFLGIKYTKLVYFI